MSIQAQQSLAAGHPIASHSRYLGAIQDAFKRAFAGCTVSADPSLTHDAICVSVSQPAKQVNCLIDAIALVRDPQMVVSHSIQKAGQAMAAGIPIYTSKSIQPDSWYASNTYVIGGPIGGTSSTITYDTTSNAASPNTWWYLPAVQDQKWYIDPDSQLAPDPAFTPGDHIREIRMKDGSVIKIDPDGNFVVVDADAQVTYKANRNRAFNPYVNAGDLVAKFVDYVRQSVRGVRRKDIPELPLQLFVNWLILEAASRDGDPMPDDVAPVEKSRLLVARVKPRCRLPSCQRFIARDSAALGFNYCNDGHAGAHLRLLKAA